MKGERQNIGDVVFHRRDLQDWDARLEVHGLLQGVQKHGLQGLNCKVNGSLEQSQGALQALKRDAPRVHEDENVVHHGAVPVCKSDDSLLCLHPGALVCANRPVMWVRARVVCACACMSLFV